MEPGKFDSFSKVFAQLTDESQNELIRISHCLLQAHQLAKRERTKQSGILEKAECCEDKKTNKNS